MTTTLISLTQPIQPGLTAEQLIVQIARVSNPSNQDNHETAPRLIAYLIDNKHWSPFEMVDMTVDVTTSRAIAAQILRHRSFCFQEFSQRYAKAKGYEPIQLRLQAVTNRQSSTDAIDNPALDARVDAAMDGLFDLYDGLLGHGVAKEVARMVLPLTTTTRIYMKGSVRSWIHYLKIRMDGHTQLEHRQLAEQIARIFREQFPVISGNLEI